MKRKKRSISDKERLDWLIKHRATVRYYDKVWWTEGYESQNIVALPLEPNSYKLAYTEQGPRHAIDAAIRAERASRKER